MPFNWNDFLTLAEQLANQPDDASKRTAISRAYYCVFNLAFARAETTAGPKPENATYHYWCWKQYIESGDRSCRQLGIAGDRMKKLRVKADYKDGDIRRLGEKVQGILTDAHQFLTDLDALDPMSPRP
jgi:uncharacterized protein (UPF0332 family)